MQLVEIVMDLGRPPLARFPSGDLRLADDVISSADLEHAISKVYALLLTGSLQLMSLLMQGYQFSACTLRWPLVSFE